MTPPLAYPPDAIIMGALPEDIGSLGRCIRASQTLLVLQLTRSHLTDTQLTSLLPCLASSSSLTHLDLSYNSLTGCGFAGLCKALLERLRGGTRGGASLSHLSLRGNSGAGDSAVAPFTELLAHTPTPSSPPATLPSFYPLLSLDLSLNPLGDLPSAKLLACAPSHPTLVRLSLGCCGVGLEGCRALAGALGGGGGGRAGRLEHLDLSGCQCLVPTTGGTEGVGLGGAAPPPPSSSGGHSASVLALTKAAAEECLGNLALAVGGPGGVGVTFLDIRPCVSPALDAALKANKIKSHPLLARSLPQTSGQGGTPSLTH